MLQTFRDGTILTDGGLLTVGDDSYLPNRGLIKANSPGESVLDIIGQIDSMGYA